jgi:glycine cleavage system aminomethyltransferase T
MTMAPQPQSRTPLYHWHANHGARFFMSDGWQVPAAYSSSGVEIEAARTSLALADISAWAKISLQGQAVPALTEALPADSRAANPLGATCLAENPQVLACRLRWDHLLLSAATTDPTVFEAHLGKSTRLDAVIQTDATSAYAGLCLMGPRTEDLLRRVTALDIGPQALPEGSCAETSLAGVHVLLIRPPATAVPMVYVYHSWDLAEYVWVAVLQAGRDWSPAAMGWEGLQSVLAGQGTMKQ